MPREGSARARAGLPSTKLPGRSSSHTCVGRGRRGAGRAAAVGAAVCSGVAAALAATCAGRWIADVPRASALPAALVHPLRLVGAVGVSRSEANRQRGGEHRQDAAPRSDAALQIFEQGVAEPSRLGRRPPSLRGAGSEPDGHRLERLLELTLPGLDARALGREMLEERWSEQTLLVHVLRKFGARDLVVASWADGAKDMTFSLSNLGIPWEKVAYVLGRHAVRHEAAEAGLSGVVSRATVEEIPAEGFVTDCEFVLERLGLSMSFRIDVRGDAFAFDAGVSKLGGGGVLDNAIVWRFMRSGFMGAARRFGHAVASELRRRARSDASSLAAHL